MTLRTEGVCAPWWGNRTYRHVKESLIEQKMYSLLIFFPTSRDIKADIVPQLQLYRTIERHLKKQNKA